MLDAIIRLNSEKANGTSPDYEIGDQVNGSALVSLPNDLPLENISLTFYCLGEVKWTETPGTPYYMNGYVFYDHFKFFEQDLPFNKAVVQVQKNEQDSEYNQVTIPFQFEIPNDKKLPSTMTSSDGFIRYYIRVSIKLAEAEIKEFVREITVLSPLGNVDLLSISVSGTVSKTVLLHGAAPVKLTASLDRKGYAPGEQMPVSVNIENGSSATLKLHCELRQIQVFMSGIRHKTAEAVLSETGTDDETDDENFAHIEIAPNNTLTNVLSLPIPRNTSLSIKSSLVTVKYFVALSLDIPHSFDLHLNLPLVITTEKVVGEVVKVQKFAPKIVKDEEN